MDRRSRTRRVGGASVALSVALLAVFAALPATAGAGSGKTIQEWNWETAADTPAGHAVIPMAIHLFEKKYHVTVANTEMTLTEQDAKLPLAFATKSSAPTVSETNEGFGSMGRLVASGELDSLSSYNKTYHWFPKVGTLPLDYNSFTADGKKFGSGNVYGVPTTAGNVGIFYNKQLLTQVGGQVPTNWSTFTNDLSLLSKHGIVPLAYSTGQPSAYQIVHVLYTIANQFVSAAKQNAFVFHKGNPSIDTPGFIKAATIMQQWTKDGYFSPGYSGLSDSQAVSQFTTGKAGFFITGDWYASTVESGLGSNAGFWVPKVSTGGPGEGWSIPKNSPNPKLAAEWISTMLSTTVQTALLKHGSLPVVKLPASALASVSPVLRSAAQAWTKAVATHNVVPYLDYATPTFLTKETQGIEELQAGQITPAALMQSLQSDYTTFWSSH